MNSKLIAGISLAALAGAAFWACGEGNINEMNPMDDVISKLYATPEELENLKDDALKSCKADMGCFTQYQAYLENPEEYVEPDPASSDDAGTHTNPNPGVSSSSRGSFDIVKTPSSSSVNRVDNPDVTSSSSETIPVTGLGSCAPVLAQGATAANKGSAVQWKFTPNNQNKTYSAMQFAQADYKWNFGGLTDDGTGVRATSGKVTYANSGVANASVTVTIEGSSETIACTPLQVNGFPISCECAVTGGDVTDDGGIATWTAACTSQGNITSYTWDGSDLGADASSYQYVFEKKNDEHTPTLTVANDDNTVQPVSCPALKATDSSVPDYVLDGTDEGTYVVAAGTYQMKYACKNANQWSQPKIAVSSAGGEWVKFNVSVKGPAGTEHKNTSEQSTFDYSQLYGAWTDGEKALFTVTVDHAAEIKCQ